MVGKYSDSHDGSSDNDDSDDEDDDVDNKDHLSEGTGSDGDIEGEMPSDSLSSLSQSQSSLGTEFVLPENQVLNYCQQLVLIFLVVSREILYIVYENG